MLVISDAKALADFSAELAKKPFVAVDTEFMREKTYWPILCLIQAAADGMEAIIDPLAEGMDLAPFLEVMGERNVLKVFHAARQDLEIFHKLMGAVPAPIFDTQIAAMACGFGDQIGYEPLMRDLVKAKIDKGSRFTDWARRPLTDKQLRYALSDVTHLRDAYPILRRKLEKGERAHWIEAEMQALYDPDLYFIRPENAWKRLKLKGVRKKELAILMALAAWREAEAQNRDVPRSRILKDEALFELARLNPQSPQELAKARSISSGYERSSAGAALLDAVRTGAATPAAALPDIEQPRTSKPPADVVELLKVLLKRQCELYDVAPKLIASSADIEEIARNDNADAPALKDWRRDVFGEAALKLKRGEIGLRLNKGEIDLIEF